MKWETFYDNLVVWMMDEMGEKTEDALYAIHTADRMVGENTGQFVALYDAPDLEDLTGGYLAYSEDGGIWYCGGNAMFNAVGLPSIAKFSTIEEAKAICEFHAALPIDAGHSLVHPLLEKARSK